MANYTQLRKIFRQIQIVRAPRHRLSTFGASQIQYQLVTDVPGLPDRARLRLGQVTAERPALITPQTLKERFHGFGEKGPDYAEWLGRQYGDALRGLEYNFRNDPFTSRVELASPDALMSNLTRDFDRSDDYRTTILRGTDKLWEMAIMKFIVEETLSSFATNIQELHERGLLEPERASQERRHREIRALLQNARRERSLVPALGKKLKEYGLFDQYQDEFFRLIQ
jgi:hypothetical protein